MNEGLEGGREGRREGGTYISVTLGFGGGCPSSSSSFTSFP